MKTKIVRISSLIAALLALALFVAPKPAYAATCTFTSVGATPNWGTNASWTITGAGCPATSTAYPGSTGGNTDKVVIAAGSTVTLNVTPANAVGTITYNAGAALTVTRITVSGTNSLTAGAITINQQNTVAAGSSNYLDVAGGTVTASSIALNVAITPTSGSRFSEILIAAGTLTVSGNITSGGTASRVTFSSTGTLNIGGTFMTAATPGTFTPSTGTINYNRAGAQNVETYTYNNLTISGSNIKTLAAATTMGGALTVHAGATLALSFTLGTPTSLTMDGGAVTGASITGSGVLTLDGNVTVNSAGTGASGAIISAPVALGATRTFTVADDGTSATDLTISGIISGVGFGVTKADAGAMALSGTNTYTGATLVSAGVLKIQNAQGTGTTAGGVTVSSGAALQLLGGITVGAEALSLAGTGISSDGALRNISGANVWQGTVTLTAATIIQSDAGSLTFNTAANSITATNQNLTWQGAAGGTISGTITTGTGTLTKSGAGTWILGGTNTYTGLTTITAGTLSLGGTANANSTIVGDITINGGTLNYSTANNNQIADTSNMTLSSGTFDPAARIETIASLTMTGGTLTKGGGTLTLLGASSITGGILTFSASAASIATGSTLALGGANFIYTSASPGVNNLNLGGDVSYAATGTAPAVFANTNAGVGDLQIGAGGTRIFNITLASPALGQAEVQIAWRVSQGSATALTKSSTGALQLSGPGTYTGLTTLSAGTLNINNATALGTGTFTISGASTIDNTSAGAISLTNNNVQNWNADFTFTGSQSLNLGTGAVSMSAARQVTVNGGVLTVGGIISGATFRLTKAGVGALTLSGTNTFTGGTTLSAGTLNINNAQALGTVAGTFIINGGTLDNTSVAAITTLNYPQTWGGDFAFTGSNNLNLGAGTITMGADRQVTVSAGTLTAGGTLSAAIRTLTKAGAGSLSFGANAVTLNGLTISAGTLTSTSNTLSLAGNFSNSGTFTHNSGTVVFNGSVAQTIGGSAATTFNNLTINNTLGVNLNANGTVTGTLTLTAGDLNTGANTLTMAAAATTVSTANDVVGNVLRNAPGIGATALSYGSQWTVIKFDNFAPASMAVNLAKGMSTPPLVGAVRRLYTLTPSSPLSNTATIQFHVDASNSTEMNSNAVSALKLFRDNGIVWTDQGATLRSSNVGVPVLSASSWVSKTAVGTFSPWAIGGINSPTAVTLSKFNARVADSKVALNWTTGAEISTAGFNIYRSENPDGPFVRINPQLIPTSASSIAGGSYQYQDLAATPGRTYFYQLEDVELNGASVRHSPVTVSVAGTSVPVAEPWLEIFGVTGLVAMLMVGGIFIGIKRRN